jgi:hypothetical protein
VTGSSRFNADSSRQLKINQKFLSPPCRNNMLYLPRGCDAKLLGNSELPLIMKEGELKTPTCLGRKIIIAFDADAAVKDQVHFAPTEVARDLRRHGAVVGFLEWDLAHGKGIDDHLAAV